MTTKPLSNSSWVRLKTLKDAGLDNTIEWLNHTGYLYAFERAGRLYYSASIKTGRRGYNQLVEFSTKLDGNHKIIDIQQ